MPFRRSSIDLAQRIQQLLEERQRATEALAQIDETLKQVSSALGVVRVGRRGRRGRPAAAPLAIAAVHDGRRRRRRRFAVNGDDSVLAFIRQRRNPTTKEVNQNWKAEGRGGSADNTLTRLFKNKQIKREPLEGQRGSRYSLA